MCLKMKTNVCEDDLAPVDAVDRVCACVCMSRETNVFYIHNIVHKRVYIRYPTFKGRESKDSIVCFPLFLFSRFAGEK